MLNCEDLIRVMINESMPLSTRYHLLNSMLSPDCRFTDSVFGERQGVYEIALCFSQLELAFSQRDFNLESRDEVDDSDQNDDYTHSDQTLDWTLQAIYNYPITEMIPETSYSISDDDLGQQMTFEGEVTVSYDGRLVSSIDNDWS